MEWYIYFFSLCGGILAGIINTLAGSGSLITLPILIFLGLPANVANGTNRVGVLFQSIVAVFSLRKSNTIKETSSLWLIIPSMIGGIAGTFIVVDLDEKIIRKVIGAVMVIIFFLVIFNSQKWLREHPENGTSQKNPLMIFVFFVIGIYGGFIQAGVGIFLLSALVLLMKYNFNRSNFLKNLLVLCFTLPALIIFIYYDQVNWMLGLLMAAGQGIGAWLAAKFALNHKNANVWIRRLLIAIIIVSIIELFDLRRMIFS